MNRIFVGVDIKEKTPIQLCDAQVHYLFHVMRMKPGEKIQIFNGRDGLWDAAFAELNKKRGVVWPTELVREQTPVTGPDLYIALIKKDNFDLVVQKATELGVRDIYPMVTERSVVHKINIQRLQIIAVEACEQSERLTVPQVHEPVKLAQALTGLQAGQKAVYLDERGVNVDEPTPTLPWKGKESKVEGEREKNRVKRGENVAFFVGPEGGWTDGELKALAAHKGSMALNLGSQILRAETACMAVLAAYRFDVFK